MLLKNKIAVISGVGKRFGMAVAHLFSKEGAKIALISRNEELLEKIKKEISNNGGEVITVICDVTDLDSVKEAFEIIIKKYGKIDILFNNAGGTYTKMEKMEKMDYDFVEKVIRNNIKSVFNTSKCAIGYMKKNGGG